MCSSRYCGVHDEVETNLLIEPIRTWTEVAPANQGPLEHPFDAA